MPRQAQPKKTERSRSRTVVKREDRRQSVQDSVDRSLAKRKHNSPERKKHAQVKKIPAPEKLSLDKVAQQRQVNLQVA
jgi:hypothetical protein